MEGSGLLNHGFDPYVTTRYIYDQWGNPTAITDPRGYQTSAVYDGLYHLYPLRVSNAKGQTSSYQFYGINGTATESMPIGSLKKAIDSNSAETLYTYDTFGRLLDAYQPGDAAGDPSTRYSYYDVGTLLNPAWPLLITEWHKPTSLGQAVRHFYDGLGREIQTHTAYNVTPNGYSTLQDLIVSHGFDALGRTSWDTVPYAAPAYVWNPSTRPNPYTTVNLSTAPKTVMQYDTLGRVITTTATDGTQTVNRYGLANADNHVIAVQNVVDANRHRTQYFTDVFGQLVKVGELTGDCTTWAGFPGFPCVSPYTTGWAGYGTTYYAYNVLSNLTRITDTLNNTTVINYDVLGRKTDMTDPDMGHWTYHL